jgi:D-alanyl-D-alanine carboxypeptidase
MDEHVTTTTPTATTRTAARRPSAIVALVAGGLLLVGATAAAAPAAHSEAPSPTVTTAERAHEQMLRDILVLHHAAGDFVGAIIAMRDPDGTISEAVGGTPSVDSTSGSVDPDVAWNIGSATKTFVAVVVLQLASEGRLDLDAGIDAFLPDLPDAELITPRQLLQHTSGLGEYLDQPAVLDDLRRQWTPAELIAVAEDGGRVGRPGESFHYANTNYIVLGEIIEQVTGNTWADEVRARISEPLGLTRTRAMTDERPTGYQIADGAFVDATDIADPSVGGAAGALLSTDRELLRFATALAAGSLLSPASQRTMMTFVPGYDYSSFGIVHSYGLGIERYVTDEITIIGHMGTGVAQSAFFGFDPVHGTAVAVMTNTAVAGPQALMGAEALTAAAG